MNMNAQNYGNSKIEKQAARKPIQKFTQKQTGEKRRERDK
jgi:hypothetical protein